MKILQKPPQLHIDGRGLKRQICSAQKPPKNPRPDSDPVSRPKSHG